MIKKVITLIIVLALFATPVKYVFADGKQPPPQSSKKGNFSKGNFSKKNAWSNNGKALAPPDPNDTEWGYTVPLSNGIAFLLLGSFVYLLMRVREDEKMTT